MIFPINLTVPFSTISEKMNLYIQNTYSKMTTMDIAIKSFINTFFACVEAQMGNGVKKFHILGYYAHDIALGKKMNHPYVLKITYNFKSIFENDIICRDKSEHEGRDYEINELIKRVASCGYEFQKIMHSDGSQFYKVHSSLSGMSFKFGMFDISNVTKFKNPTHGIIYNPVTDIVDHLWIKDYK